MNFETERIKREELKTILCELSASQNILKDKEYCQKVFCRLENIYACDDDGQDFRHFYSDIFSILSTIHSDTSVGNIEVLTQNLNYLRHEYKPQNMSNNNNVIDISDGLKKLYDHVNLEVARITYADASSARYAGEESVRGLQSQVSEVIDETNSVKRLAENIKKDLNNRQKEYISILGIFSAIVIAFTANLVFSSSVLDNIAKASIYRTIIVSLIIGIVIINIIFGLLYYINSILERGKCVWPMIISNIVLVLLLVGVLISWKMGLVEKRNQSIESSISTTCVETESTTENISQTHTE